MHSPVLFSYHLFCSLQVFSWNYFLKISVLEYMCTITPLQLGSLSHFQNILSSLSFLSGFFFFHWFLFAADFVAGHRVHLVLCIINLWIFFPVCVPYLRPGDPWDQMSHHYFFVVLASDCCSSPAAQFTSSVFWAFHVVVALSDMI